MISRIMLPAHCMNNGVYGVLITNQHNDATIVGMYMDGCSALPHIPFLLLVYVDCSFFLLLFINKNGKKK